jgi:hypothetical protein
MKKYLLVAAALGALAVPAMADEVGVRVGPVGAGVTVGESHRDNYDRDRDRTTVIKEREPTDRTTIIKKDHGDGVESKTVIHHDDSTLSAAARGGLARGRRSSAARFRQRRDDPVAVPWPRPSGRKPQPNDVFDAALMPRACHHRTMMPATYRSHLFLVGFLQ